MINEKSVPSRSKHFSTDRENMKSELNIKNLAAEESTTMEVIFPSLNWNPMCPVESWVLSVFVIKSKKQWKQSEYVCFPSILLLPDKLDKFFGYLTYQGKSDSMQNQLCYFGIRSSDNNLPCGEWGFSQRAGPWRPLLCCWPRPFSTSRAPGNVEEKLYM